MRPATGSTSGLAREVYRPPGRIGMHGRSMRRVRYDIHYRMLPGADAASMSRRLRSSGRFREYSARLYRDPRLAGIFWHLQRQRFGTLRRQVVLLPRLAVWAATYDPTKARLGCALSCWARVRGRVLLKTETTSWPPFRALCMCSMQTRGRIEPRAWLGDGRDC
ncbi:hypothetical protein K523DRAFT_326088 [Schizophyllum commune Tattone D]|nr:hypothetical protein K523DRAFT_326088 [Schizophyllum commune Tattone D]